MVERLAGDLARGSGTPATRALMLLCVLLVAHPLRAEHLASPAPQQSHWEPLAEEVGQLLATSNNPQATLVIVDNGAIAVLRDYPSTPGSTPGNANAGAGTTPFRLGSITKLFTALTLLHACAATDTALDTPLASVIDKSLWQNPWRETHPIRLNQLIELSAGFADISGREFASAQPLPRLQALALDPESHTTHWTPGLQHSYTNLAPAYSALAVEALTKQSFATYLAQNVLQPVGMPDATLRELTDLPGGFQADGITPIPYWHTIFPAFGGLNATPRQFANLLLRLSRRDLGPALNTALKRRGDLELWQPTSTAAARQGLALGYGAGVYATLRNGQLVYGHGGDADGYRTRFGLMGNSTRGYFVAINSDNPRLLRRLQAVVESALSRGLPTPAPKAELPGRPSHAHLDRFTGSYYPASTRFGISRWRDGKAKSAHIRRVDRRLSMQQGDRTTELLWLGGSLFRRPDDPVATVVFVEAGGVLYLQGELGNWQQQTGRVTTRSTSP